MINNSIRHTRRKPEQTPVTQTMRPRCNLIAIKKKNDNRKEVAMVSERV